MASNQVSVVINGTEYVSKAADSAGKSLGKLSGVTGTMSKSMVSSLAAVATKIGGLVLLFKGLKTGISQAADFEQIDVSFEVLIGNAQKAQQVIGELRDFSASTPLEFKTITKGAQNLMAFGVGADSVKEKMEMLGNASMGNEQKLDSLVRAYGKINAKGKASLEELNMITEAGVPILQTLADQYGVSTEELFKMVSAGKVGFADVDQALTSLTTGQGQFAGMLEKQSQTLNGVISTFRDNLNITLAELMETLLPAIKQVLSSVITMLGKLRDSETFQAFAQNMGAVLTGIVTVIGNLPDYVATIVEAIKAFIDQIFTVEYWKSLGTAMWEWFKATGEAYLQYMASLINLLGAVIWEPIKFGFQKAWGAIQGGVVSGLNFMIEKINVIGEAFWNIGQTIGTGFKDMFRSVINFFIDQINIVSEKAWNVTQTLKHPLRASKREAYSGGIARLEDTGNDIPRAYIGGINPITAPTLNDATFKDVTDGIKDAFVQAKDSLVTYVQTALGPANTKDVRTAAFGHLAGALSAVGGDIKGLMDASFAQTEATEDNTEAQQEATQTAKYQQSKGTLPGTGGTGILDILKNAASGLGELLGSFGGKIVDLVKGLGSVTAIMDPISTILGGVMDILGPVIDEVLAPMVGILRILGQTIGKVIAPVLKTLGDIIEIVAKGWLWMYNSVIVPVGNMLITLFNWIHNGVAKIVNGLIDGVNGFLGWLGVNIKYRMAERALDAGRLDTINYETLTASGSSLIGNTTGSTGSSTSVQQVTIEVHQYFQGNVIGDGGMEAVGEYVVKAVKAYAGIGGNVEIISGVA